MENEDFARFFEKLGDLMEIKGANPFKVRAMRNAVHTIDDLTESIERLVQKEGPKALEELPGIGKGIRDRILQLIEKGTTEDYQELTEEVPVSLLEVTRITGVGPKKAWKFYQELGIETVDQLEEAAKKEQLRELAGMGKKSEEKILKGIVDYRRRATDRIPLGSAIPYAEAIVEHLRKLDGVLEATPAGSIRRRKEDIGDIDILVSCEPGTEVMEHMLTYDGITDVLGSGETKTSVVLRAGLQVDVRVLEPKSYGAALHYFTGSKAHNIVVRQRGQRQGLKISEYGVFDVETEERLGGRTEEEVFSAVGLPWIPPELRENRGEFEAADAGELPELVELGDIRGDLQMHTKATDGAHTVAEMAEKARSLGYGYIAITDHGKMVAMANGLDEERLAEHHRHIDEVQADFDDVRILRSIECDIHADGNLDLAADALRACDVVLATIHYRLDLPKDEMTTRYLRAIETGLVDIIGHPTGRILGRRSPFDVDLEQVFAACAEHRVAMEVNAHPDRLDLKDTHARLASEMGVPIVISTDAHQMAGMDNMRFGVYTARRAWLEKTDVLNARPLDGVLEWLEERRERFKA